MFGKSKNTTVAGVLTLVVVIGKAALDMVNGQALDWTSTLAAITSGIGLIMAKDFNATGGTK